jgi:hypothetical protein
VFPPRCRVFKNVAVVMVRSVYTSIDKEDLIAGCGFSLKFRFRREGDSGSADRDGPFPARRRNSKGGGI